MKHFTDNVLQSRAELKKGLKPIAVREDAEEGGCGVVGFASSVKVGGKHIFKPSRQMHNRGNGKGGGIAAAGLDPEFLGVSQEILDTHYLLHVAFLDKSVEKSLEDQFIRPMYDVVKEEWLPTLDDISTIDVDTRPPDVKRYFVRVKKGVLAAFAEKLNLPANRKVEDEFVFQNSINLNNIFYASLGEQQAFVMSHGRDLLILKIVGYAEDVVRYYKMDEFKAHIWIAHQRYPTKGKVWHPGGAHPFIGMNEALVHNGDFANYHSVSEYLKQRNLEPQFLTDTEVAALTFDLWNRVYEYPMEYCIEGLAPTLDYDFDQLPLEKQKVYKAIQQTHMHGSPDGPWFFIIARTEPDIQTHRLIGITDTAMLRPQVFAMFDGEVQIGLLGSEKQAIDATLQSLASEDDRFRPVADSYWNARGGSATDGGSFIFNLVKDDKGKVELSCENKFGDPVALKAIKMTCDFSEDYTNGGTADDEKEIQDWLTAGNAMAIYEALSQRIPNMDFKEFRWSVNTMVKLGVNETAGTAIEALTLLLDRKFYLGLKKRSSLKEIVQTALDDLFDAMPLITDKASSDLAYSRITFDTYDNLRAPQGAEKTLIVDATDFEPEGERCDSTLIVKGFELGWRKFITYRLCGQRFHGCGLGPGSEGTRIDIYGSSGDYIASGMMGAELYIHNDAQDQLGQVIKAGKLVIHGSVGQTFMYGAKGGNVYVLGNAAGRPLVNAVGCPRVVINGTCLDYLAESFMAGDPHHGGGFAIINGVEFDYNGNYSELERPYPGGNLFSLASGGALYIRDPRGTLEKAQLNGGTIADVTDKDWNLILPYLQENEKEFGILINDLLTVEGKKQAPGKVYRKVIPIQMSKLANELTVEGE